MTFSELQQWKENNTSNRFAQRLTSTALHTVSDEGFALFRQNFPFSALDHGRYKLRKMVDFISLFEPEVADKPTQWLYPRLRRLLAEKDLGILSEAAGGKSILAMLRSANPKGLAATDIVTDKKKLTAQICLKYRDRNDRESNLEMLKELDKKIGAPLRSEYRTHMNMARRPGTARQFKRRWIERARKWGLSADI